MAWLRRWSGPLVAAALIAGSWLAYLLVQAPPLPRTEPAETGFSAERAWRHIEAVARAPHPVGTAEHDRVRAYLVDELTRLGLELDTLTAISTVRWYGNTRSALTRNLAARLPGTASSGALLLMSHYDGVPLAPAAGDAGIGVATVLETARALAAGPSRRNDVIILLTDAEELGLLGAQAFADGHSWMEDVAFVLNFEARGTTGPAVMFETGPGSEWAVRELGRLGRRPVSSSVMPEAYARMPNDTDFSVFSRAGLPGLNFAIGGSPQWYHTPRDHPATLSRASLQHMGDNALALAARLADLDLAAASARGGRTSPTVYFQVPGLGLARYGTGVALTLAGLLTAAYLATTAFAVRRGRLRWWGIPVGLVLAFVALAAATLAAHLLWLAVRDAHAELGSLHGRSLHREWPYTMAILALATATVAAVFGLARRWISLDGLALGALAIPILGGVAVTIILPAASYILLWPGLASLAVVALGAAGAGHADAERHTPGAGSDTGKRSARSAGPGRVGGAAIGLAVVVVLAVMVPVLYQVHMMLGLMAAPGVGLVAGLTLLFLVPLLDALRPPHGGWLPGVAILAAAAFVGIGLAGAAPSDTRPAPSNLLHVQDSDDGLAWWATPEGHDDGFIARFVPAGSDTVRLARYSAVLRGPYRISPAPAWAALPGRVTVLEEREQDGLRTVRLRLEWDDRPMMVEARPARSESRLVEPVPGVRVGDGPATPDATSFVPWRLEFWGMDSGELVIEAPAGETVDLLLSARYPGLPHPAGSTPARPADRMATPAHRGASTLSDVRVVLTRFEIPGSPASVATP